ncbi:hypothetical protein ABIC45_001069 [Mucilaginibacter rubeus]|jgi:hypothetical protein
MKMKTPHFIFYGVSLKIPIKQKFETALMLNAI